MTHYASETPSNIRLTHLDGDDRMMWGEPRPEDAGGRSGDLLARPHKRGAPEDVALGDLNAVEVEGSERLEQDRHAGDDRGRAVGMQAHDLAPLGDGHRRQAREQQVEVAEVEYEALHLVGIVRVQPLLDRGARGRGP